MSVKLPEGQSPKSVPSPSKSPSTTTPGRPHAVRRQDIATKGAGLDAPPRSSPRSGNNSTHTLLLGPGRTSRVRSVGGKARAVGGKAYAMVRRATLSPSGRKGRSVPEVALKAQAEQMSVVRPMFGPRDAEPTVSIVIPAKNEARNLQHVFATLPQNCEVILVDGNSTDDTVSVTQQLRPDIIVIGQTREGKGNALACGFAAATGDFIVMMDADGSNDPEEIPRFVTALKEGADFAKGSRFLAGGGSLDISLVRRIGNFWLNRIVNLLYGTRYTDLCYGYNAFRRACLDVMALNAIEIEVSEPGAMLCGDGFEVETLINVRIAKAGLRVTEVPSFERLRHSGASNLNAFSDGLRVLRTIRAERQGSARKTAADAAWARRETGASWALLSTLREEAGLPTLSEEAG